jgi:hypothetical protein
MTKGRHFVSQGLAGNGKVFWKSYSPRKGAKKTLRNAGRLSPLRENYSGSEVALTYKSGSLL